MGKLCCLTLALSGTQHARRSGNLLLRVRDEQPVSQHIAFAKHCGRAEGGERFNRYQGYVGTVNHTAPMMIAKNTKPKMALTVDPGVLFDSK